MDHFVTLSSDVSAALSTRRPVVALETTLVTHGLPAGEGIEAARELEAVVREEGAQAATIGVVAGRIRVGLTETELLQLASTEKVQKLNPGNLAAHAASGQSGSTTVAATVMIAARVGIRVFCTGGIGGVHYDAPETGDVSADPVAVSRCPVAVVCAGAKAILDLARTVELLETLGVPVIGFGTDRFPAFYRRDSGLAVDARCDTVRQLAATVRAHFAISVAGGLIVANPIPAEFELPADLYRRALRQARIDAENAKVRGRAVTPFLLERMRVLTEGASVFSNRSLLVNNARLAARLAIELASAESSSRA